MGRPERQRGPKAKPLVGVLIPGEPAPGGVGVLEHGREVHAGQTAGHEPKRGER